MKTPEDIKKGLECCSVEYRCPTDCRPCPYVARKPFCESEMHRDALGYIQQLEAELEQVKQERDGLNIMLEQCKSMLETRTRERDAALGDMPPMGGFHDV